jgi:hypothetical protein
MVWKNITNYMISVNVRLSFLVGDTFFPSRLELEGVTGMSNCKFKLDAVVELCDCLLRARFVGRFRQNGHNAALIDSRRSPIA